MKHLLLILALCGFFDAGYPVLAQDWFQTSAPLADWNGVASSADGTLLVAVCSPFFFDLDGVYVSTNSGATWNITSAPNDPNTNSWIAVASSADGDKLVAVSGGGDGAIYTSTNGGFTWQKTSARVDDYDCVASSADGTKLVAACNYGGIVVSSNSGSTWVDAGAGRPEGGSAWHSVAMSADGKTMVAAEGDGYVAGYPPYSCMVACSTNSGVSWWISSAPTNQLWWAVACSANGSFMVAAALESYASSPAPGPIYVSHDSGVTWTPTTAPLATWGSLACSADGTRVTAGATAAAISTTIGACYSIDSGTNWTVDTTLFGAESLASSSDGSKRVAASSYLYVSRTQPGFSIPKLNIARSANNVLLYWVTNQFGVYLQQETNLAALNWINMTNIPVISNGQNQVLVLPSDRQNFFRLASP